MRKVATIGSRDTPSHILTLMEKIGEYLVTNGYIVASGNAEGADQAFARGANKVDPKRVQLFLPWHSYESDKIVKGNYVESNQQDSWFTEAEKYHPNWANLKDSVRKLMARNIGIVDGSCMVIAYLNHGKIGFGGSGHGWRAAQAYGIPCIDLSQPEGVKRIMEKMK